ncbi:hypothetical protein C8J57DRAFT_1505296 [Mycena rebaudengoi]|nr:hypothetical protein C8J57DRAFT_1505296 [Mycena rebaudengoi]
MALFLSSSPPVLAPRYWLLPWPYYSYRCVFLLLPSLLVLAHKLPSASPHPILPPLHPLAFTEPWCSSALRLFLYSLSRSPANNLRFLGRSPPHLSPPFPQSSLAPVSSHPPPSAQILLVPLATHIPLFPDPRSSNCLTPTQLHGQINVRMPTAPARLFRPQVSANGDVLGIAVLARAGTSAGPTHRQRRRLERDATPPRMNVTAGSIGRGTTTPTGPTWVDLSLLLHSPHPHTSNLAPYLSTTDDDSVRTSCQANPLHPCKVPAQPSHYPSPATFSPLSRRSPPQTTPSSLPPPPRRLHYVTAPRCP